MSKTWILMLYQVGSPQHVIRVSEHKTKREAHIALHRMISKHWCDSLVENSFGYNGVQAMVVEADIVETVQ